MTIPKFLALPFFLATATVLAAIEIPPGGSEMSDPSKLNAYADGRVGSATKLAASAGSPGGWRIDVKQGDSAKSFQAQCGVACPRGALGVGDHVLAVVRARVASGTTGALEAKLQLARAPYTAACGTTGVELSPNWTDYPILFKVATALPEGQASLTTFCAQAAQVVEIESIRVFRYPPQTDVSRFPRIRRTYPGREPEAPWRKAALDRIEKNRKHDLTAKLVGADGTTPVSKPVHLTLRRHDFGFGSATPASFYSATTEDARRYREIVDRLFSIIVFENDLKDMWWGAATPAHEKASRLAGLDTAFAWLGERRIAVRGHYLMQVAVPGNLAKMDNDAVRNHYFETVRQRIGFVKGRVCEWDVINHPVAWGGADLFTTRPGLETIDREVFTLARGLTDLPFFINEDQIFRPGHQSDGTFDYIKAIAAAGFKVAGLGNQGHVHESFLPSPEHVLAVTDHFAQIVPAQAITEFDIQTVNDEELAADYTRDILIACFSHPAYTSFLFWGFWEGSHWRPDAASWNKDWSIRKRGEVLEEWLGRRWRTEVTLDPDANGVVKWRGFPGWYEVGPGDKSAPAPLVHFSAGTPGEAVKLR